MFAFVGSQDCANPRHFRLLVAELLHPRMVRQEGIVSDLGSGSTVIIAEKFEVFIVINNCTCIFLY